MTPPRGVVAPQGIWRARVTRLKDGRPYVKIPRLTGDDEYGPLDILQTVVFAGALVTGNGGIHTHLDSLGGLTTASPAHGHTTVSPTPSLVADDRVLVAFIEGRPDDPVIVGRLV